MSLTIQNVPVSSLHFDPRNPRLPSSLHNSDDIPVINWMLDYASLADLMMSIGERGYFPGEPLLVTKEGASDAEYVVVEGNRRLAASKLLVNPELAGRKKELVQGVFGEAKNKPLELPVIVYDQRDDVLNYLGYRHITGINRWGPLAKAKYLEQLRKTVENKPSDEQFRILARDIGSRSDHVAKLLAGLNLYKHIDDANFFSIPGLDEESISFSLITTAISYKNISEFIKLDSPQDIEAANLDKDALKELTVWLFKKNDRNKTPLGESRNLSMLARVVAHPDALKAFRKGGLLEEADVLTAGPTEAFENILRDVANQMESARSIAQNVKPNESHIEELKEIQKTIKATGSIIRGRLEDMDDEF